MKSIKVVIGSNFGDEGKGLTTDYFASQANRGIVVRFNSGAQAGHTVTTPNGKRHPFGHFGSGTFAGLPTYLSKFFVVNPLLFKIELEKLEGLGVYPTVYISPECLVSTPYDMMVNQIVEAYRDKDRHGSCGVGFNETIVRSEDPGLKIVWKDTSVVTDELRYKLNVIRKTYVYERLEELGVKEVPYKFFQYFNSDDLMETYLQDLQAMHDRTATADVNHLRAYEDIIFEGAQGLMLDQGHEYFPHVTRSNTGIKNVVEILKDAGLQENPVDITYITRCYLTRHGAGPFLTEIADKPYSKIVDMTNVPNEFQGSLRFGILDVDLLSKTIKNDVANAAELNYNLCLMITCLDQLDDSISYLANGLKLKTSVQVFLNEVESIIKPKVIYTSSGPTRETVKKS